MSTLQKEFEKRYSGTSQHKSIKSYKDTSVDTGQKLLALVGEELDCRQELLNLQHQKGNGILRHKGIYLLYKRICELKGDDQDYIYTGRELRKRSDVLNDIKDSGRELSFIKKLDALEDGS